MPNQIIVPEGGLLAHSVCSKKYSIATDSNIDVITSCVKTEMTPLTDLSNLPKNVQQFISKFDPVQVFDKDGAVWVEVKITALRTLQTLHGFLNVYHSALSEFSGVAHYVGLHEESIKCVAISPENNKKEDVWIPIHFYVVIRVREMIIEKLRYFFCPEMDFSIPDGLQYLLAHGLTDDSLQNILGAAKRTFYRYKSQVKGDCQSGKPNLN